MKVWKEWQFSFFMFTIPWTNEDVKISTLWGSFGRADLVSDMIWLSKVANYWSRDFKLARTIERRMTWELCLLFNLLKGRVLYIPPISLRHYSFYYPLSSPPLISLPLPPIPLPLLSVTHVIPCHRRQPRHHCHPCRLRHPIHPPHLNTILLSWVKNRFALFTHVVFHSFSCIILSNILALDPCFLAGC